MGILKKKVAKTGKNSTGGGASVANFDTSVTAVTNPPQLARRRANQKSSLKSGRTIVAKREKVESSFERLAARKKDKRKNFVRILFVFLAFVILFGLGLYGVMFVLENNDEESLVETVTVGYTPTIEVIDEDAAINGGGITTRMNEYIGQAEADFRELGYVPIKAVIPSGSVREVDFFLDGYNGRIKMIIDRGTGVSVEDADRMIRYLTENGEIENFEYIDVRVERKAYWK